MHKRSRWQAVLTGLFGVVLGTGAAWSAPFPTNDPVSMAMGGTGVALPTQGTGSLHNPSALAVLQDERPFGIGGHFGGRAFDPDDFVDAVDDFQDRELIDETDRLIADAENGNDSDLLVPVADGLRELDAALTDLEDRPLQAEGSTALSFHRLGPQLAFGVSSGSWAAVGAEVDFRDDFLLRAADEVDACRVRLENGGSCPASEFEFIEATSSDIEVQFDADSRVDTPVRVRGLAVRELGLTLAHLARIGGRDWAIGGAVKSQRIETFDYVDRVDVADAGDVDDRDFRRSHNDVNFDLGVSTRVGDNWRVGLTARNVIARTYETARGNEIDLDPQLRAGVAYEGGTYRIAGDADLTRNDAVGFGDATRFVSAGAEFDVLHWFRIRTGYRVDLENSARNAASFGVGFSPGRLVHINLATAGNRDETGGALQVAFTF